MENNEYKNHVYEMNKSNDEQPAMSDNKKKDGEKPSKTSGMFTKKTAALLMTGCVTLSGLFGFGGTYLANELNGNEGVMYQSVARTTASTGSTDTSGALTTQQIAETAANSVVEITTESMATSSYMQQMVTEGAGSGVIVTTDGYIVTNNHVIEGANKITVRTKDEKSYEATLVGTDSTSDVALLKISANDLQPAVLGDSDALAVGEEAVAIGNPLGELGGTVTNGIISALDREITLDGETMNLLQTNAAINPGNSGGGLFNEYGELIGIVVAKSSGDDVEGLGFAIPVNDVKSVVESLQSYGYVKGRVSLGVSLVDVNSAEAAMQYRVSETGVYIAEVTSGSAAASAGLQAGDRIVSVDGTAVSSASDVKTALKSHNVGDEVSIEIKRNNKTETVKATLGEEMPTNN